MLGVTLVRYVCFAGLVAGLGVLLSRCLAKPGQCDEFPALEQKRGYVFDPGIA